VSQAADGAQGMFLECPLFDRTLVSGLPLTAVLRQGLFLFDDIVVEYESEDEDEDEDENN
jgi:hypothetical protein